jgi:NAD(P)H-nitrite reductase large subunit
MRVAFGAEQPPAKPKYVCPCLKVDGQTIHHAIRHQGADTLEKLQQQTQAGTGFRACIPRLKQWLKAWVRPDA